MKRVAGLVISTSYFIRSSPVFTFQVYIGHDLYCHSLTDSHIDSLCSAIKELDPRNMEGKMCWFNRLSLSTPPYDLSDTVLFTLDDYKMMLTSEFELFRTAAKNKLGISNDG